MGQNVVPLFRAKNTSAAADDTDLPRVEVGGKPGLLPSQQIPALRDRKKIDAPDGIPPDQIQPASIDLRLGAQGLPRAIELLARQGAHGAAAAWKSSSSTSSTSMTAPCSSTAASMS